jgi:hypothetical protein
VPEAALTFDPSTRRLTLGDRFSSRRDVKIAAVLTEVVEILRAADGGRLTGVEVKKAARERGFEGAGKNFIDAALHLGSLNGTLRRPKGVSGDKHWTLLDVSTSVPPFPHVPPSFPGEPPNPLPPFPPLYRGGEGGKDTGKGKGSENDLVDLEAPFDPVDPPNPVEPEDH